VAGRLLVEVMAKGCDGYGGEEDQRENDDHNVL
jgi:hypothetical protein